MSGTVATDTRTIPAGDAAGAFVVSLDFELHWGLVDKYPPDGGTYRNNLLGTRSAIRHMLELFAEFDIAATWATVGFLFAESREEKETFSPIARPTYDNARLSPYTVSLGENEAEDAFHFATSCLELIQKYPKQEIGTHTFSHYYCQEPGQTLGQFREDISSAIAIATKRGIPIRSIVFPRNQFNADYIDCLREFGIDCVRGNQAGWMYQEGSEESMSRRLLRMGRLADSYIPVSGSNTTAWNEVMYRPDVVNVPASRFLRPYSHRLRTLEPMRLRRIIRGIRHAARTRNIYHLWWHPHNFGVNTDANIAFLREIFQEVAINRSKYGLRSLSMGNIAAQMLDV